MHVLCVHFIGLPDAMKRDPHMDYFPHLSAAGLFVNDI